MPSNAKTSFFSSSPEELAVSTNSSDIEKSYSIKISEELNNLRNELKRVKQTLKELTYEKDKLRFTLNVQMRNSLEEKITLYEQALKTSRSEHLKKAEHLFKRAEEYNEEMHYIVNSGKQLSKKLFPSKKAYEELRGRKDKLLEEHKKLRDEVWDMKPMMEIFDLGTFMVMQPFEDITWANRPER